jgi:hypothetical protein
MCFPDDYLNLTEERREDFERNFATYEKKTLELLNGSKPIGNADVCRALEKKPTWGHRYWRAFLRRHSDSIEGERKITWKQLDE